MRRNTSHRTGKICYVCLKGIYNQDSKELLQINKKKKMNSLVEKQVKDVSGHRTDARSKRPTHIRKHWEQRSVARLWTELPARSDAAGGSITRYNHLGNLDPAKLHTDVTTLNTAVNTLCYVHARDCRRAAGRSSCVQRGA